MQEKTPAEKAAELAKALKASDTASIRLAERLMSVNKAMEDMKPEDLAKFEKLTKDLKEMNVAGSKMPDLFNKMTGRASKFVNVFANLGPELKNAWKIFESIKLSLVAWTAVLVVIEKAFKAIINVVESLASMIMDVLVGAIGKALDAVKYLYNQFKKLGEQIVDFNIKFNKFLDQQAAGFFKLTQAGGENTSVIDGSIDALRAQGLAIGNVNKVAASLYDKTVLFREASRTTRIELVKFVSVLDQAGITADSAARMIQILNKTYGDSGRETKAATERIIQFARASGISARTAASDFGSAAVVIAAHGEGMEEVFKGLLTQSSATTLGISDLLTVAGQFDTFEKSAQSVGRLNAMLGGPFLNSIEMVYMKEDERVRTVLAQMEASGQSWKSMGRFTKMAYAHAAGIRDMSKANDLFAGGLVAFDMHAKKASEAAKKQAILTKAARMATEIWENFQNALKGFAISFRPILTMISNVILRLADMNFESKQAIGKIGLLAGGVAMLTKWFGPLGLAGSLLLLYDQWHNVEDFLGPRGLKILNGYKEKLKNFLREVPALIRRVGLKVGSIYKEMVNDPEVAAGIKEFKKYMINTITPIAKALGNVLLIGLKGGLMDFLSLLKDVKIETPFGDIDIGGAATKLRRKIAGSLGGKAKSWLNLTEMYEDKIERLKEKKGASPLGGTPTSVPQAKKMVEWQKLRMQQAQTWWGPKAAPQDLADARADLKRLQDDLTRTTRALQEAKEGLNSSASASDALLRLIQAQPNLTTTGVGAKAQGKGP